MGSSPTSGKAEDLPQYHPGCYTGHKTLSLTVSEIQIRWCRRDVGMIINLGSYPKWVVVKIIGVHLVYNFFK